MRYFLFLFLLVAFSIVAQAQFANQRQLILFGDTQSAEVKKQLALFKKEGEGFRERHLQVVMEDKKKTTREKYGVDAAAPFMLILVGKDGGEKYRSQKVTKPQQLFHLIDAMPMRRAEMRRAGKGKQ